jgi:hypothetical protein
MFDYNDEQRVILAHNHAYSSAIHGHKNKVQRAISLPLTEVINENYGYNMVSKVTELEGI